MARRGIIQFIFGHLQHYAVRVLNHVKRADNVGVRDLIALKAGHYWSDLVILPRLRANALLRVDHGGIGEQGIELLQPLGEGLLFAAYRRFHGRLECGSLRSKSSRAISSTSLRPSKPAWRIWTLGAWISLLVRVRAICASTSSAATPRASRRLALANS